ncbi:MAG: helix-turn-helix domain-containing protein [Desulfobulbaceae bacterium]|nr:MAG: helix-turn-helix domain-containing protein [Desulfobulbaceae bacterium]
MQQLQIEAARTLFASTAETVDGITLKTGYENTSSFRKLFKKCTILPPSQYRKKFSHLF